MKAVRSRDVSRSMASAKTVFNRAHLCAVIFCGPKCVLDVVPLNHVSFTAITHDEAIPSRRSTRA